MDYDAPTEWSYGDEGEDSLAGRRDDEWREPDLSDEGVEVRHGGVEHQTERAVLYRFGDRKVWLPMSRTSDDGSAVTMPAWMVRENSLHELIEGGE